MGLRPTTLLPLFLLCAAGAQEALTPLVVLAERETTAPIKAWSTDEIARFDPRTIDELLATDPGFSLYRAQSAIFANPTTTGISLRNTGATAASRSLVLLDGIPQNDPFGGWVNWSRYDPRTLQSARILHSAGSAAWGNLSAAGSIRLTRQAATDPGQELSVTGGGHGLVGGSASLRSAAADGSLAASFHAFHQRTDGFHALPPSQRGPVDTRLETDYSGADLRLDWQPRRQLRIEPTLSFYDESRSNGTPLTGNTTRAFDASVRVTLENDKTLWQALAYYQHRTFTSVFSSVNAARTSENVALDQFDVPGEGLGGAMSLRHSFDAALDLTVGSDFRLLEGSTNEDAGGFRRRRAGGDQSLVGLFAMAEWRPAADTQLDGSLRLDHWRLSDGFRSERAIASGALLRADAPADRSAWEPSASVELSRELQSDWTVRLSGSTAFRLPTLNELHRPYRVRSDVTEANPNLDPERFFSVETGLSWQASPELRLDASLFHHWIHDAIANVPVTDPAEISQIFGTLPAGGTGAQRRNVERAEVSGLQLRARWEPSSRWSVQLDGIWSESRFTRSRRQPLLLDQAFPQTPEWRWIGSLAFQPTAALRAFVGIEHASSRFDDLLGKRPLNDYTTVRTGLTWELKDNLALQLRGENLLNADIVSGLAGNGLQSLGQPRTFWLSIDWTL